MTYDDWKADEGDYDPEGAQQESDRAEDDRADHPERY